MCSGPERSKYSSSESTITKEKEDQIIKKDMMTEPAIDKNSSFSILLELAADDDFEGFKNLLEQDVSILHKVDPWYTRKNGSKQMVIEQRTPLMVAATYGSLNILRLILSKSDVDVNSTYGLDSTTPLHCAASGGSANAIDVVKLLISAGADPNITDASGLRPVDVIIVSPKLSGLRTAMVELLSGNLSDSSLSLSSSSSSPRSPSLETSLAVSPASEKREYPIDPSLPDIKNSIYSTDEFRMYSFKIRPCSRAYSHDWTECPFVHPGENARRRDPRKFHYSCVPCPDFRKGSCRRADLCEYAHGVFECWLHPAQYRTRLCKDGTGCARRVCFFAHKTDELRPLYVAVQSPRSNSPSAFNNQPLSPTNMSWPQPNIPTLSLPGSNFQSSRLRSSINARDIPNELLNDLACFSRVSNLEEQFSAEFASSPRFSPRKMLSPINTNVFSLSSPNSRTIEPISPSSARISAFAREKQYQQMRSLSSRDLMCSNNNTNNNSPTIGSPVNSIWSRWGSPDGKVDWSVPGKEFGRSSFEHNNNNNNNEVDEEPDLSWVQTLVKESSAEESTDQSVLGAWLEKMQLESLVA
ncbi:zinc finger CCCH domain-containing protein 30-like [Impatiens glandulifera]|uniref:zinc finger CCCH domain-containing protein 30-like n=1 Tax=Impatiens glandulifera TaxID=253017 RepID=UPI001FB0DA81|nr:zinc finger CCCH domain-containing protein 30-like [Impatiens glandulifera]